MVGANRAVLPGTSVHSNLEPHDALRGHGSTVKSGDPCAQKAEIARNGDMHGAIVELFQAAACGTPDRRWGGRKGAG